MAESLRRIHSQQMAFGHHADKITIRSFPYILCCDEESVPIRLQLLEIIPEFSAQDRINARRGVDVEAEKARLQKELTKKDERAAKKTRFLLDKAIRAIKSPRKS